MEFLKVFNKSYRVKLERITSSDSSIKFPKFTTLVEPHAEWYLHLEVRKYGNLKVINLRLVCKEEIPDSEDYKVDMSIKCDSEKIFRSSEISRNGKEFCFKNFIDLKTLFKMTEKDEIEIVVELFLRTEQEKKNLDRFTNSKFLSDIQISIQGEIFYAHKIILAKCPYFRKIFNQNKDTNEIVLDNMTPDTFEIIINYIYSNEPFMGSPSLSKNVLIAANYLQMEDIKTQCENCIRSTIAVKNVCSLLLVSMNSSAKFLMKHCLHFILNNIHKIDKELQSLKTEPLAVLCILREIFQQFEAGYLAISDEIHIFETEYERKEDNSMLGDYGLCLNDKRFSDVTIKVRGKAEYQCHKVILSVRCPVFYNMLKSNMKETLTNVIEIKNIEPDVFYEVLRYIYTGKVENLEKYGSEVLQAADQYNLEHLKRICEKFLAKNLTHDNVLAAVKIADTHNALFLSECCAKLIVKQMISCNNVKNIQNPFTLDMFLDCQNIFYQFLKVLTNFCEIF